MSRLITTLNLNALKQTAAKLAEALRRNTYGAAFRASGATYRPNGERECARRRRQIARGMLRVTG